MPEARLKRARATLPTDYRYVPGESASVKAAPTAPPVDKVPSAPSQPRHRMAGSHDGMFVTEHHRGAKKR